MSTMSLDLPQVKDCRVVRLNAAMFPALKLEHEMCAHFGIAQDPVEADDPQELIGALAGCDALAVISTALPTEVIESLDRCRLISRLGNGTDKIDVATATERGIVVSNAPFFCAEEMTDHIMAMLLSVARQLPRMEQHMRAGRFPEARAESKRLHRLSTCTLGIVGFGATGEMVASRAMAFGLRVLATRRNLQTPTPGADALGVAMVDMETLLAESDFVYLHVEAPDEAGHNADVAGKVQALEDFDEFVVGRMLGGLEQMRQPVRILLTPDHRTPIELRTHSREPVPFALWGAGIEADDMPAYNETAACDGAVKNLEHGHLLMELLVAGSSGISEK